MANQKGGQVTYLPSLLVSSTVQPEIGLPATKHLYDCDHVTT